MLNLQESHVWEFMPNDAMRVKSFVFLVRQRATKDAVQSQAMAFWYIYSRETVGEYRKITAEQAGLYKITLDTEKMEIKFEKQ